MSSRISLIIAFFVVLLFNMSAGAQEKKTKILFTFLTHDFGTLKEEGGDVDYEFEFINSGNSPLIIKNVVASCGCTVPKWSTEPILPRNKGSIKVIFNPMSKPGPFNKNLTVYTNTENEATILNLVGRVVPKPKKPVDEFPDLLGKLRMVSRYLNMGDVTTEKISKKEFRLYNNTDSAITVNKLVYNGAFMHIELEPNPIAAKSASKLKLEYDAAKRNEFGYVHDKLELVTDDKIMPVKLLYVAATISKYFPPMTTAEKLNAPKIGFDKTTHDFGAVKKGEKLTTVFFIKNEGKEHLKILKVKPSCGCTMSELEKNILQPGESSKLTLIFDTSGKEGVQEKHINIYCNDPINFNPVISLKAKINK